MTAQSSYLIFAQSVPGLEPFLQDELSTLGLSSKLEVGGVQLRGNESDLWRICLESRLSESVRVRLKAFEARGFNDLEKGLRKLPFRAFLEKGKSFNLKVTCHQSRLYHSGAVEERVAGVLEKFVGLKKSPPSEHSQRIYIRLQDDEVQVSLDASGERMHRRGYRTRVEAASVRETLAAALLRVALQNSKRVSAETLVLWDPFCGAGTIPLEAAHHNLGRLPGAERHYALESFRGHDEAEFQSFKIERAQKLAAHVPFQNLDIWGSDRSERAIGAADQNGADADLNGVITWKTGEIEKIADQIPAGALIVTNPPYGKRLADTGAITQLLRVLKARSDLVPAFLLVGGAARDVLPSECPALFRTKSGGLPVSARIVSPPPARKSD